VILDVHLDDNRSGLEVLELIRLDEQCVDLTVVILTAHSPLDDEAVGIIQRSRAYLLYKQQGSNESSNDSKALSSRSCSRPRSPTTFCSRPSRSFPFHDLSSNVSIAPAPVRQRAFSACSERRASVFSALRGAACAGRERRETPPDRKGRRLSDLRPFGPLTQAYRPRENHLRVAGCALL
jgi:hypothetical protein